MCGSQNETAVAGRRRYRVKRRLVSALVGAALAAGGATVVVSSPAGGVAGFGDVPEAAFYTEAVQWMVDNDITTGTSENCFSPLDPVTRGQAAAFMWRMEGEPAAPPHPFTDVTKSWQQGPVSWMFANEITTGTTATTYSPEDTLTRGQLAALLWRLAGEPAAPPHPFVDITRTWQHGPVSWMASTKPVITTGTSATTFSPDNPVTRGQLATFFHRYKGEPAVTVDPAHPTDPACAQQAAPLDPGDARDCDDFPTQADAQAWFDTYFPWYGDIAGLDADNDGQACEVGDPATPTTTTTTTIPPNPGDAVNCSDFTTQAAAQAWFDTYFPFYGDVARLDGDGNGIACESLP